MSFFKAYRRHSRRATDPSIHVETEGCCCPIATAITLFGRKFLANRSIFSFVNERGEIEYYMGPRAKDYPRGNEKKVKLLQYIQADGKLGKKKKTLMCFQPVDNIPEAQIVRDVKMEVYCNLLLGRQAKAFKRSGKYYVVSDEWYSGIDLLSFYKGEKNFILPIEKAFKDFTLVERIKLIYEIALQYQLLEQAGILVPDLDLENMMIYWDESSGRFSVKLIDFSMCAKPTASRILLAGKDQRIDLYTISRLGNTRDRNSDYFVQGFCFAHLLSEYFTIRFIPLSAEFKRQCHIPITEITEIKSIERIEARIAGLIAVIAGMGRDGRDIDGRIHRETTMDIIRECEKILSADDCRIIRNAYPSLSATAMTPMVLRIAGTGASKDTGEAVAVTGFCGDSKGIEIAVVGAAKGDGAAGAVAAGESLSAAMAATSSVRSLAASIRFTPMKAELVPEIEIIEVDDHLPMPKPGMSPRTASSIPLLPVVGGA